MTIFEWHKALSEWNMKAQTALLLKGITAASAIVALAGLYVASLIGSGFLDSEGLWDSLEKAAVQSGSGSGGLGSGGLRDALGKAAAQRDSGSGGLGAAHDARSAFVASNFSPEARQAIQRIHDYLQRQYGDDVYRNKFKSAAAQEALKGYAKAILSGRVLTPEEYLKGLTPADIKAHSDAAIRDLNGGTYTDTLAIDLKL
jgi:hypothetical protein